MCLYVRVLQRSYKYLCDEAGIPCVVVFGDVNFGPGMLVRMPGTSLIRGNGLDMLM